MNAVRGVCLILIAAPLLLAQSPSPTSPDGLTILRTMSDRYAQAKSWYIEDTAEQSNWNDYSRAWFRTVMVAAVSGNRYHYEGRSNTGSAIHISDGKTVWNLRPDEHAYTQQPASPVPDRSPHPVAMTEMAAERATSLAKTFAAFASQYTGATRLPDETITLNGTAIPCYVVKVTPEQRKGPHEPGYGFQEILWIEKATWAVRKTEQHGHSFIMSGTARLPQDTKASDTYTIAELNGPVPETLFRFNPPHDARLMPHFPDTSFGTPDLTGLPAPEVTLAAADGKSVPLSTYRGKPVLLDFWATWCAPCTEGLPKLAEVYKDAAPKGLVLLSIDEDDDLKTATDYLAKHGYTWPNTQDDGKIGDAFSKLGIPLYVLIDPEGKIVYYESGGTETALRKAIASLGPQFASLAPAPKPQPSEKAAQAAPPSR